MDERQRAEAGMRVRREVLGDAHVDRSLARLNASNREFQDLITRYAWGEIWTRPGLERRTRCLITLGMLVALNRSEEFRLHVRAALNNGLGRDDIREVLLQAAISCRIPAANAAFRMAEKVFATMDREPPPAEEIGPDGPRATSRHDQTLTDSAEPRGSP
ncbi:MAG TPA: 4-carboxymuconolactone decarboxylase [Gemmatimonadales bacterium]|nr:4-carboxymuconolactone decarboxylase [Gemmatimonadales bacterium]